MTLAPASVYANCTTYGSPYTQGLTNYFQNCGANNAAFVWFHGRGVQRIIGPETVPNQGNTTSGHDSANRFSVADAVITNGTDVGFPAGSLLASGDPGNQGWDGCILNLPETGVAGCGGSPDFGVMDYTLGGIDPGAPNIGRVAAVSVDFNPFLLVWLADNAGAPAGDGTCEGDALSGNPNPITCGELPIPNITRMTPVPGGGELSVSLADSSSIPVLDDCNVAETRALNCPRNFLVGRALVYKRGSCFGGVVATFDRRTWVYPASPPANNLAVFGNWQPYSNEDANLNGILDAGEDGTNGGVSNGRLDPIVVNGLGPGTTVARVPMVPGATDCIYFGTALALDNNQLSIDPPDNTIFGEMVLSTVVSVNPNPFAANTAIAVADLVTTISASKGGGKAKVDWTTGVEMTTSGFNVIGTKKGGGGEGEVKINSSLVAAKEGTTGKGASYSVSFDAGQLKGSSAVYIEVVKNNGSKERFGPASF